MITVPKTDPPQILYKYYPPERIDVIENLDVRFSSPSEFNDAFDSYHLLPRSADPKTKRRRARMRSDLGVFCMSERAESQTMWVNYAKNHTGFVIRFDSAADFFEDDGRTLRKVVYQDKPPIFDMPDENGCFYKSPEWRNEDEWRCIRSFGKDERRMVAFRWSMVKCIIFGHQIDRWMISRIVQWSTILSTAEDTEIPMLLSSNPLPREWRFVNEEKHFVMCEHCNGDGYTVPATPGPKDM
jgi:Protein of unknown function (DUF2971)